MVTNNWVLVFSGTDTSGTLDLTTTAATNGGPFTITSISGTWDGQQVIGLMPINGYQGNDNLLTNNVGKSPFDFDNSGFSFETTNSSGTIEYVNIYNPSYLAAYANSSTTINGTPTVTSITQVSSTSNASDTWSYDISALGFEGVFTVTTGLQDEPNDVFLVSGVSGTWGGQAITGFSGTDLTIDPPYGLDNLYGGIDGFQASGITLSTTDANGNPEQVELFKNGTTLEVTISSNQIVGYTKDDQPIYDSQTGAATINSFSTTACFLQGTAIATTTGQIHVEDLGPGDRVLLARGGSARVVWVGSYQVDCTAHPFPDEVRPIRIQADTFAPGVPGRDLFLSPEHAVFLDQVLVPVSALVDGKAVRQVDAGVVRYFHVELARHDVILAENTPVESYLDSDGHAAFDNAAQAPRSDVFQAPCAPLVRQGPRLEQVRALIGRMVPERAWCVIRSA